MGDKDILLEEGTEVKGGRNPMPSTPRPSEPPRAQGPSQPPPTYSVKKK